MTIDAWIQHPTPRFLAHDMLASLRRWTGEGVIPTEPIPLSVTLEAMDAGGVQQALISAWHGPEGSLVSNDEVAAWVAEAPDRLHAIASVDLRKPMEGVRELRRRVNDDNFKGLRVLPWLWEVPPTDRRFYPLYAACVDLNIPFCTQVGHTGPLRPSETGRPIPYIDQLALDFPELTIVCGHVGYPWTEEMVAVGRGQSSSAPKRRVCAPNRRGWDRRASAGGRPRFKPVGGSRRGEAARRRAAPR